MNTTYYRVTTAAAAAKLLDSSTWKSRVWCGYRTLRCESCASRGRLDDGDRCRACHGTGEVEDVRYGVSACASVEDLVAYFASRSATLVDGAVLVEMEADLSEDEDHDAGEDGDPVLVLPTRIVSIRPLPPELVEVMG